MCDFTLKDIRKEVGEVVQSVLESVLNRELTALHEKLKADLQAEHHKSKQHMRQHLNARRLEHQQWQEQHRRDGTWTSGERGGKAPLLPMPGSATRSNPFRPASSMGQGDPKALTRHSITNQQTPPNVQTNMSRRRSIGGALLDTIMPQMKANGRGASGHLEEAARKASVMSTSLRLTTFSNSSNMSDIASKPGHSSIPPNLHVHPVERQGSRNNSVFSQDSVRSSSSLRAQQEQHRGSLGSRGHPVPIHQIESLTSAPPTSNPMAVGIITEEEENSERSSGSTSGGDDKLLNKVQKKDSLKTLEGKLPLTADREGNAWDVESMSEIGDKVSESERNADIFSEASHGQNGQDDYSENRSNSKTTQATPCEPPPEPEDQDQTTIVSPISTIRTAFTSMTNKEEAFGKRFSTISRQSHNRRHSKTSLITMTSMAPRSFRDAARAIVGSSYFDLTAICMVILNSITIGMQTDYSIHHMNEPVDKFYRYCELTFCLIFTMELMLRLTVFGPHGFFCAHLEWRWNWFDTFIVCAQLLEEGAALVTDTNKMPSNFNFVRILRLLRLVRIMRLVRLLRFIGELRTMVYSIFNCLRSLFWTLVLLFGLIYVMSVYIVQLIADHGEPQLLEGEATMGQYYSSLSRAVLSLFQGMTGGVDWDDLIAPLMDEISPLTAIVFTLYIAFAVLAMMNVVTGIFVESALLTAKADKEAEITSQVRKLFKKADKNTDGQITWEEFTLQLSDPSLEKYFKVLDIEISEARGLFLLLDTDESGTIDAEEFVMGILRLRGAARAIDLSTLMYFNKRMMHWWTEWRESVDHDLGDIMALLTSESSDEEDNKDTDGKNIPYLVDVVSSDSCSNADSETRSQARSTVGRPSSGKRSNRSIRQSIRDRRSSGEKQKDLSNFGTWADLRSQAERKAEAMQVDKKTTDNSLLKPRSSKSVRFGISGFMVQSPRISVFGRNSNFGFQHQSRGSNASATPIVPTEPPMSPRSIGSTSEIDARDTIELPGSPDSDDDAKK